MFKKLSLSIALYGLLITPLSPLGVYKSYDIVDFVNRNFINDDQSTPNLYPLSFQSPNLLTKIEGVPNSDSQLQVNSQMITTQMPTDRMPKYLIEVIQISNPSREIPQSPRPIYIVKQVRKIDRNGRISKVLYRWWRQVEIRSTWVQKQSYDWCMSWVNW